MPPSTSEPNGPSSPPDDVAGARTFLASLSRAGRVERIARRTLAAWGFDPADALGRPFADAPWWRDVPETRTRIVAGLARARGGDPMHGTVGIVTARGESRELTLTIDPIGEGAAVEWLRVAGMDVTALRRQADGADGADGGETAPVVSDAAWRLDLVTNAVSTDSNHARVFGLPPEQAATATYADYVRRIHPEDAARVDRAHRHAAETGEPFESTFRALGDAGTRWLISRGEVERDADGTATHLVGVTVDITPQRAATEALEASEARYRRLFESTEEGYCVLTPVRDAAGTVVDMRFAEVNPACARHTGLTDIEGRLMLGEVVPTLEPHWLAAMRRVLRTGESTRHTLPAAAIGRWIEASLVRIREPAGTAVACLFRDVTERRDADERLRRQARDLAVQDERKNVFLATLAHELRNPLAPLSHALQLLEGEAGEAGERAALHEMMARQVNQLTHLVDDLLDVSRISNGKLTLRESAIELAAVIGDAIETVRPLIEGRGHAIETDLPTEPVRLRGDALRLTQVLSNLLTNAARYTDEGGRIEVRARADDDGVRIAVRDDGAGLDAASLGRIFEMFTQVPADSTTRDAFGGLGLGLTLARHLVELHDGTIDAASAGLGHGSTFTITLPASRLIHTREPSSSATPAAPVDVTGLAVAVVDDNRDAADALAAILRRRGCTVSLGHDGAAALELVRGGAPDVLLLDIGLPDVSGYEIAERLRAEATGTVLVALTGWGTDGDIERGRLAGFAHHLVKPVRASVLLELLSDVAAAAETSRSGG